MPAPTIRDYASHLPATWQARVDCEPESSWWRWRDHEVHVLRRRDPEAPVRMVLVHGAGGHARALWPLAALVPSSAADLAAVDLPLYGATTSANPSAVRYPDWIALLADFLRVEDDGRPLVLLGASIGGMLAYEVAAQTCLPAAVVATCLLDPRSARARAVMTRFGPFGMLGGVAARMVGGRPGGWPGGRLTGRLAGAMVPIGAVAALRKMSHSRELATLCAADPRGGGAAVPLGFLASFMLYRHTPPEEMSIPVTLAHPAEDDWTPVSVSLRWLRRLAAPADLVLLRGAGHFPVEEPGVGDLVQAVEAVLERAAAVSQ